jgi:hypothetical protein
MSLDLIPVREHHEDYTAAHNHVGAFECCTAHPSADDVPALLAEVERLRRVVDGIREYADKQDEVGEAPWLGRDLRNMLDQAASR